MIKGFSTWGALIVLLGFGLVIGGASQTGVSAALMAGGAGLGLIGGVLVLREATHGQGALARAEALDAAFGRDRRALRIVDAQGRTLAANAEGRRFWGGADPLAVLGARRGEAETEADHEAFERLEAAYRAGLDATQEVALTGASGTARDWVRVEIRALDRPKGARLLAAADVSARRAVENVLKGEREYLGDFLDFLPVGVYALDSEQCFRYVNRTFADWLGQAPDKLLGQPLAAVLADGSTRPEIDGAWRGLVRLRGPRGGGFTALLTHTLYEDNGETLTRAALVRDVDADGGEGSVAGGSALTRRVFDESPVGIAVVDVGGLPYPMLAEANDTLAGMLGRQRDDLIGLSLEEIVDPAMRAEVAQVFRRAAAGVPVAPLEVRLDNARDVTAMLHIRPLPADDADDGETPPRQIIHVIDTTDRRALQMQTAQAQKMQAMGQLAGGVAHDFNNLLTAMIGFCDLLLQRHGPGSASFTDIMQIKQNANRAANLVRQLLAFSRRQPLLPRFVRVPDALAELSHLLRRLLGETIALELIHGRDVGYVRVDPGQFDQVIINLAVNARDAMVGGGTLAIRTGAINLPEPLKVGTETVAPGHYVTIEVADTGTGIAKEDLARIFEPFFTTKAGTAAAGTGLGLSTVYGIVRQTEGTVTVESRPGNGATFTIYLPRFDDAQVRARAGAPAHGLADPPEPRGKALPPAEGKVVLIVEDEDAVRVFGSRALKAKGYSVLEASDGERAIALLADHPEVDVLVSDMVMPGMDGATLARLVRQTYPSIRVVLMSGYSEEIASDDLADSPDILFLAKPFSLDALGAKVAEALDRRDS